MPDELRVSIPFTAGRLSGRLAPNAAPSLAADELGQAAMTTLVVVGDRDGFCPLADLHALTSDRVPTSVIHGADHFFSGFEDDVRTAAEAFCRRLAAAGREED